MILRLVQTALLIVLFCQSAFADALPEFYRGVRAMGMGNAFTAVSDDDDAVFYNPAGIAFNQRIKFNLMNPKIVTSGDVVTSISETRNMAGQQITAADISRFLGKNIVLEGSVFPSFFLPNFVIGYLYQARVGFNIRNAVLPQTKATALIDNGLVTGAGYEFRGFSRNHFLRVGASVKYLMRYGFDQQIPFSRMVTADRDYFKDLMAGPSPGIGGSLGLQYEMTLGRNNSLTLATSWTDIGDTQFGGKEGKKPPSIKSNLSAGFALMQEFGRAGKRSGSYNAKFTGEIRHLTYPQKIDPRLKMHIGSELQMGDLSIQAGLNQLSNICLGGTFDIGLFKITGVTYGVEQQNVAFLDRERFYMVQFTFSLDVGGGKGRSAREEYRRRHPRAK
jgi:hypothetical protein